MARDLASVVWRSFVLALSASPWIAAAYEPEAIESVSVSPDGSWLAVGNASGELGVLSLGRAGATHIYSRALQDDSFGWSADASRLAFVEQIPNDFPALWVAGTGEGGPPRPVLQGGDWKSRPSWVAPNRLLYLSDRDSDHINLWQFDLDTSSTQRVLNLGDDISGLWVSPRSGSTLVATTDGRVSQLLRRGDRPDSWLRLPHDGENEFYAQGDVAFSPQGDTVAYMTLGPKQNDLWVLDLRDARPRGRLRMERPPGGIAISDNRSMLLEFDGRLHRWDYTAAADQGSRQRDVTRILGWKGPDFSRPFTRMGPEWGAAIHGNIIMTASGFGAPSEALFHARSTRDLVTLGLAWQEHGDTSQSRRTLQDLWDAELPSSEDALWIALARAQIERLAGKPRKALTWVERARPLADPAGDLSSTLWREHLLLLLFDRKDAAGAENLISELPAGVLDTPLGQWIEDLLESGAAGQGAVWRTVGHDLRRARWKDVGRELARATREDPESPILRQGVALLLQGELEPVRSLLEGSPPEYEELLSVPEMQYALLELSGRDLSPEMDQENLRGMLLLIWAKAGQLEAARSLVARDLRDPSGSSLDYLDMLDRFLEPEELDLWMERAVGEILLSPRIVPLLDRHMLDTRAHLVFRLAKAKEALIQGDTERLDDELLQIENDMVLIPARFWDGETAKLLMLPRLFRAKYYERLGYWGSAMSAYEGCVEIMHRFPGDWGVYAFDLAWAHTLVTEGRGDPEDLRIYLQVIRGLGDPLINPAHEEDTVRAGLANLSTLESQTASPWLPPFLRYARGVSLEQLGRSYASLAMMRQARAGDVSAGLRARVLVEEAAVRSSLGQYRLAVDLLTELCEMELDPAALSVAIQVRAQAERQAGLIESQENRIRYLCHELKLPFNWSRTLIAGHTVLPLEESR